MITAQDIREKTFEKSTFGGYAMGEVDDFLDELANDLAANQKEMAALRGKMKVLVDKIKEYQATEEAMRMALVSAQKIAKDIEDDSQSKADAVLADARKEAEDIVAAAQAEADRISGGHPGAGRRRGAALPEGQGRGGGLHPEAPDAL